ncbi:MAG: YsnF/AvaK domain-containing protein, partial [Chloroflexi bacterium]|nr:YsnF/AvaK domain-containing protein [Chloroflexota bacterium]
ERTTESAGEVRIDKNVVEEERTLDVPVTREEVQIRSVATDGSTAVGDDAFSGDTIRVPVTEERVDVSKEVRVVEEIEISKRPVTETQRVSETVRREQVDIDDSSNAMSGSATTGTTSSVGSSGYDDDLGDRDRRDREGRGEVGAEAAGGGAVGAGAGGALGDRAEEEADDEPRR